MSDGKPLERNDEARGAQKTGSRPGFIVVGAREPKRKPDAPSGPDKRRHPRLPLVVRCEFRLRDDPHLGYLTNLSLGGAFLAIDEPPDTGTRIRMLIRLPWNMGDVTAETEVIWSSRQASPGTEPAGIGLSFTRLDPEGAGRLKRYVDRYRRIVDELDR